MKTWLIAVAAVAAGALEAVAADAPPAEPALEDYGKLPAIEDMSLSPSGEWLAWIGVAQDQRRAVIKRLDGPGLLTVPVGKLKARSIGWLPKDHVLIETSDTIDVNPDNEAVARGEFFESSVIDVAGGAPFVVFAAQKAKIRPTTYGFQGVSSVGDRAYAYFGGLTLEGSGNGFTDFAVNKGSISHTHIDLYRVDLKSGVPEMVAGGSELHDTDWVVDTGGHIIAHDEYDRSGVWRLYRGLMDMTLVAKTDAPIGDIALTGLGRTPGTVLVYQPFGSDGEFAYVEYPLTARATPTRLFGGADIARLIRSEDTGLLIGGVTNEDDPRTIFLDPALQEKFDKVVKALPGETVSLVSTADGFEKMILLAVGPGDSGTYYLVDYPKRQIEVAGWRYPTILQGAVGDVRVVSYKAADGLPMQGILTLPPGREARNLPVVMLPHGGPEDRDYKGFDWWAQALASRGYAVFQPNFRGSSGFGKAFRDAGFGQWGRKMQTDISDGLAELARQGIVDPKRACIVGASYGGYAALAGVTVQQGLYRCAVSVGGISDLNMLLGYEAERFGENSAALRHTRRFLGVTGNSSSSLDPLSPRKLARRADAPILLIFGKDDSVVSINQSRDFADALKAAGKPYDMVVLAEEDHWLSREATRTKMLQAAVAFVEKNNPPS
jgi:dipeptidyl aminopeptidase/acylaminoacyl peptidase